MVKVLMRLMNRTLQIEKQHLELVLPTLICLRKETTQGAVNMRKRSKLKLYEYQEIFERYYERGHGIREISRYLGRSSSTVSRALKRDEHPSPFLTTYERAVHAYEKSQTRMSKSRRRERLKTDRIRKIVIFILCRWHWSPETISDFLKEYGLEISARAIYSFIKEERKSLRKYLRFKGKRRRQRVSRARSHFREGIKKSIHIRPELIESGHWEIDTVHSKRGSKGGVLTLKEVKSKQSFYFILRDLSSKSVMEVLFPFFQSLAPHMRRTLTSDNGSEFVELYKLEKILPNFGVYYCDPYKAWQRGSVENANGLLRWFFPKKTDFSKVSEEELRKAQYKINGRPMKVHNGKSATYVYKKLLAA